MPSFVDVLTGTVAKASDVQQIVDSLKGTAGKGIPLSPTAVNDAINFALAVKNNETGASKALIAYKADGTVLLQVDKNGVVASPDGTAAATQIATLTSTQTLTNKTLTAPHMTTPVVDSGGLTITLGGLTVSAGGLTITAGGLTVTAGASTFAGGLTVTAGGLFVNGATPVATGTQIGYGGTWGTGNGGAATLPVLKGTGFGATTAGGWIQINLGGTMCYIPYWV